ncbi:GNAT family N-acetyltransferase, partial [archaeon]
MASLTFPACYCYCYYYYSCLLAFTRKLPGSISPQERVLVEHFPTHSVWSNLLMMSSVEKSLQTWVDKHLSKSAKSGKPHATVRTDVFNLPLDIVFHDIVSLAQEETDGVDSAVQLPESAEKGLSSSRGLTCLTCKLAFDTREDQYAHFKSDLHRLNLSRKLKGEPPVEHGELHTTIMEDTKLSDDSEREEGGTSSGESEDSDTAHEDNNNDNEAQDSLSQVYRDKYGEVRKSFSPRYGTAYHLSLKSLAPYVLTISGALFHTTSPLADRRWFDSQNALFPSVLQQMQHVRSRPLIAVFILRSGKFGGAIFNPPTTTTSINPHNSHNASPSLLVHKVLRRYTVRAKAGGGQSSHDNKGGKAKSMGAQLRRYGERMLEQDDWEIIALKLKPEHGGGPDGTLAAFTACFRGRELYVAHVCGLDYRFVASHGAYRQLNRQAILRARQAGFSRIALGYGAGIEKERLGCRPQAHDVYLK